jgi:hypothetical protein
MNSNFTDFIKHSISQKDISLVIAKDDQELGHFQQKLDNAGFKQVHEVPEILHNIHQNSKVYYCIEDKFPKSLYDLIIQYPTGQVEIFDVHSMKSTVVDPNYEKSSIILLCTKDNLSYFQSKGYQVLEHVGIAYQS